METRIDLASAVREAFLLNGQDIRTFSPLTLAFLGDGIFDLVIRTLLAEEGNRSVHKLHQEKSALVRASAQARMADALAEALSEEELSVYKRGRNAKSVTVPKHAEVSDYRKATGFEALLGYLYLQGKTQRILELTKMGLAALN